MIEIKFEVQKIKYRNEESGYTVMDVKLIDHPENVEIPTAGRTVTGIFQAIHKKDEFVAEGDWVDAGKFGYQFKVSKFELVLPETSKGMVSFLSRSVKGIGPLVAKRIVQEFEEETFQIIMNFPEKLLRIKGVTQAKKDAIHFAVNKHKEYEEVALFLLSVGLTHVETSIVYEELGYAAISKIKNNPYVLLSLKHFTFKTADIVAQKMGFSYDNSERILIGIMHFLNYRMQSRGDMYTDSTEVVEDLSAYLNTYGGYENKDEITSDKIKEGLKTLNDLGKIFIEKYGKQECVYITYFHHAEDSIVKNISKKINEFNHWICRPEDLDEYIQEREENGGMALAEKQKQAIRMTLFNKLSILSGGPGTGKTHTINAIINTAEHFLPGAMISLCAPTGRAAKRMTELTGRKAETIHRLIKIYGGDNGDAGEETFEEVDADFLIVDESSMIDAHVFNVLLNAVTDRTRILLVGDYNQLPSVGPGLILRDLMESGAVPKTILTEIFRQAQDSQIVTNSYNIIHGKGIDSLTYDPKKKDFLFKELANVEEIINITLNVMKKAIRQGATLDEIQVLTVLNGGDLGVHELNRRIQKCFNPKTGKYKEVQVGVDLYLRIFDRVMQTRNNYDLNVFNGEVGRIESIDIVIDGGEEKLQMLVDFGDRDVIYGEDEVHELVLAYAMSVHKSQGSEFKYVIMPIHRSLKVLLNRNIIYTAWTRAKEKVILLGSRKELEDGIGRVENTVRNSLIRPKLEALTSGK